MKKFTQSMTLMALTGTLTACGSDETQNSTLATVPLIVEAGQSQIVDERETINISASVSGASSGFSGQWSQISGPMVDFSNANALSTQFTAPNVREESAVQLQFTATDGAGRSASDRVDFTIENVRNGPDGPSPQGIPDDADDRRRNARNDRETRRIFDSREVRTYDGTSNNVENPDWGATFIHLQRLAPNGYADGVASLAGPARPSARIVSNQIVNQDDGVSLPNSANGSDFIWQWGQFIDHDLDLTDGAEEAANISVPAGDPFFDPNNTGIAEISFSRALFDHETGFTTANPREQENEITSWIDGSMIYGSDDERAAALRVGSDSPYLKTSEGNLLPFNENSLTNANGFITDPTALFLAGDIRANEQLALATLHTLWVREHNRLAAELTSDFPAQTANEIFELTRRLVIAKIQIITFDEWLPALVGEDAIPDYSGYDPTLNPSIFNEFSAAAFRLGHSMLNTTLLRLDASGNEIDDGHVPLRAAFFTAPMILTHEAALDPILRGLASQRHQTLDAKVVHDLRNFLFGQPGDGGLDLPSLNIQRGRDHGLPDYNSARAAMGLDRVLSFDDISSDPDVVAALSGTYATVDDIDLWIGGLAENPIAGSLLGELFQAIIVKQYRDLRDGDRFWYENDLTRTELEFVRGTTLADVIRANTSIGDELQDNVFYVP